jgi:hypothetical protein
MLTIRRLAVLAFCISHAGAACGNEFLDKVAGVRKVWESRQGEKCEVLLRRSFFEAVTALEGLSFETVLESVEKSGLTTFVPQERRDCEAVLERGIRFSEVGPTHELVLKIVKADAGMAECLEVFLRLEESQDRETMFGGEGYPAGSVVSEVSKLEHFRAKGKMLRVVNELEVAFSEIREPGSIEMGYGFTVRVGFTSQREHHPENEIANVTYRVLSGRDPITNFRTGKTSKPTNEDFRRRVLEFESPATARGSTMAIWVSSESTPVGSFGQE